MSQLVWRGVLSDFLSNISKQEIVAGLSTWKGKGQWKNVTLHDDSHWRKGKLLNFYHTQIPIMTVTNSIINDI